ncbi:septal ring lytic transglycosylase RlpA family protein [Marinicellulosiphila megalodicopiae]|uniref:septal ring lytic transglycosylase RlpA family protein n=1 Tax=Marinicellulosiphila megalodicopiae TaxID=2724896 RepID=UPI003BB09D13
MKYYLIAFITCLTMTSCSSKYRSISDSIDGDNPASNSRYAVTHDSLPKKTITADQIENIKPRHEPLSAGGNKDYEVWGKKYTVLNSSVGYSETGIASWYGAKFHNHKTSNGETYNMYQLSAAHRSLPLPTYLKVTNLDNGLSIIVRVNDRGPFHEERLIDLSYAAAVKLDFINTGTARVKIEAVQSAAKKVTTHSSVEVPKTTAPSVEIAPVNTQFYLQLAAFKDKPAAQDYAQKVKVYQLLINERLIIESVELHRVKVGPLSKQKAQQLKAALQSEYQIRAFLLFE